MCVTSFVGDHFTDKWKDRPWMIPTNPPAPDWNNYGIPNWNNVTKQEFEDLKKEVLEMKELLKKALEYDKRNNEPHCEMYDKVKLIKDIAKAVGVDLSEIFPEGKILIT